MSIYEVAKDALKIAQQADNVDLISKILDVQKMALDMQEKQQELVKKIEDQAKEIALLNDKKLYAYAEGHTWKMDPENPSIKLCPVCLDRDGFESPMSINGGYGYCTQCKGNFK